MGPFMEDIARTMPEALLPSTREEKLLQSDRPDGAKPRSTDGTVSENGLRVNHLPPVSQ